MDRVVDKIAGLGVPGLVLLIAIAVAGPSGGAAIVVALAILGGPLGMLGGIGALLVISMISKALATYGAELVATRVVQKLVDTGSSREEIRSRIAGYPISRGLREKLLRFLDGLKPESA